MNFSGYECNFLYKAVKYYQLNKTTTDNKEYWDYDFLLRKLQPYVEINGLEPGFNPNT